MSKEHHKVLLIAYACEPGKTSEPGVGWNFVKQVSKYYDATVITRANNRTAIELDGFNKATFLYYDLPRLFMVLKKRIPFGTQIYYFLWQWLVYMKLGIKALRKRGAQFKILHHLNFGITWITPPGFILKTPFIWGPIGGGDIVPYPFLKEMGYRSKTHEITYFVINNLTRISLFSYLIKKKASAIIFRSESARQSFTGINKAKSFIISETATSTISSEKGNNIQSHLHAICVGRMNYWKGFLYAVKGFHSFLDYGGQGKLELFGDGPEKILIENYVKENNLEQFIFIRGLVKNEIVLAKMKKAHVLIHPSFRDGGSWSIMEAMSNGLPVVCLNTSGPKDMVTEKCGLLINLKSPDQVKADIGTGLFNLLNDKKLYNNLSKSAILRISNEYNWDRRGEQIKEIYDRIIEQEQNK